jgi:hypothetical protein
MSEIKERNTSEGWRAVVGLPSTRVGTSPSPENNAHPVRDNKQKLQHIPSTISGSDLLTMEIREPNWAVQDILPEGLSILGGKPKMGKSWLALGLSVAVATGGAALGNIRVEHGDVLYLGLEDNPRRLQGRLKKVLSVAGSTSLDNLTLATEWPRLDETGLTLLGGWLTEHPDARLVVIDTLARIRSRRKGRGNGSQYDDDYASIEGLQGLASQHGVAILVITHLRKLEADDPLDMLNATLGLSGAADAIHILKRERGRHDATLFVSGRDVNEQELALKFDATSALWSVIGDAAEYRQSQARIEVMDVLRKANRPLPPKEVAELLNKNHGSVRKLMWEMSGEGVLSSEGGKYSIKISNSSNLSNSDNFSNPNTLNDPITSVTRVTQVTSDSDPATEEALAIMDEMRRSPLFAHLDGQKAEATES